MSEHSAHRSLSPGGAVPPRSAKPVAGGLHAVVIGGSVAGLMAARVLAAHFDRVTIVERDALPSNTEARKAVPQGHHAHLLQALGCMVTDALFPTLRDKLRAVGVPMGDLVPHMAFHYFGVWFPRFRADIDSIYCTRPRYESLLREELATCERVRCLPETKVVRLLGDARRIRGVVLKSDRGRGPDSELAADLVVDASGRGTQASDWLTACGLPAPRESSLRIDLAYTSRLYRMPASADRGRYMTAIYPYPPYSHRGGVLLRCEEEQWILSLHGYEGDHPPTDEAGFLEFARSLPQPQIYEAIREAEPLSPIHTFKIPTVRRLYFEEIADRLDGFIATGDAVCQFNPIFAQGMTVAGMAAQALHQSLVAQRLDRPGRDGTDRLRGLAQRFARAHARQIALPWFLTNILDLRFDGTRGRRPPGFRLLSWFAENLMHAASRDVTTCYDFFLLLAMRRGILGLLKPSLVAATLAQAVRGLYRSLPARANTTLPTTLHPSPLALLPPPTWPLPLDKNP